MLKQLLPLLILANALPLYAQTLSHEEQQICDHISASHDKQIKFLSKLVNINSGTANVHGVKRVGELMIPVFHSMGFSTHWVEEPANMHRAPTLVAERHGTQGQRLLLIGHLDTVASKKDVAHFVRHGNRGLGSGTIDDKGGDVILLYALAALHNVHALTNTSITVVLTGDEEDSGKPTSISRRPLFAAAEKSDVALDFENAVSLDTATIARRGIASWRLQTKGAEAHASAIFQANVGDGAIFEMSRILNTMRAELSGEKNLSFNPGILMGGTKFNYDAHDARGNVFGKTNVIAQTSFAHGDIRYLSAEQRLSAEKKIQTIVSQHLPGTDASVEFQDGIPAMEPTTANLNLLKKYSQASEDVGAGSITPLDPLLRGAGDISHIAGKVSANLAGLGPTGEGAHSTHEYIDLTSLPIQTKRAALLIYRLTRK